MSSESEPLESYYSSTTWKGIVQSGYSLLRARHVQPRSETQTLHLKRLTYRDLLLYGSLIVVPSIFLDVYQRTRTAVTKKPRHHPEGAWQWYLHSSLREDLARFTNETTGYHENRPESATELDDLTAWAMTAIQFLWNYDDLMDTIWDEWFTLKLVDEAAVKAGFVNDDLFRRLQRQWEIVRPYSAPLNGTYADIRRSEFEKFITPRVNALPADIRQEVINRHRALSETKPEAFQRQMSMLATMIPLRYTNIKRPIPLWDARIAVIVNGQYYLIDVIAHDDDGDPIIYEYSGRQSKLLFRNGLPVSSTCEGMVIKHDQVFRRNGDPLGYLDMPPAGLVMGQLQAILEQHPSTNSLAAEETIDILLAETPRRAQKRLRSMLPPEMLQTLKKLSNAPLIINWDERPRDRTLAELRRIQRGVGDHALTISRTEGSLIFDQSHIFFDGTWSLAMAEVLTNAAVMWCDRCTTIAPTEAEPPARLTFAATPQFLAEARALRQVPEISAETTIWDISNIFTLRKTLAKAGTRLTVNDLLVITRIFHAAHYRPSPGVQKDIDAFQANAQSKTELRASRSIDQSLERGRITNPALLIPVDASPTDPAERLYPITFRNLADSLVWIWDDTWDAYQEYRRIEPPNTPEGIAAFQKFVLKRTLLVGNLRAFSHILDANKAVAIRGESFSVAIIDLLVGLPIWLQTLLKEIPEQFSSLNEIIRGDEVYSNVGRVVQGSTLKRFMTAKDDGNTKALAWGFMSDDDGRLIVTMRDFRPHVKPLIEAGRIDLAYKMAQDYVIAYTADLIGLVARLSAMLQAERPE
jgi:hypothetical protein